MIRYDITQGSDEWHQLRVAKVGGSTSHQLHVKSDTLLEQLLSEMAEPWQPSDDYVSEAMIRGRELEPLAVEQVGAYVGKSFRSCGWIQSDECELIGASPDGISEDETEIVETKCPSAKAHISYNLAGIVPSDYVDQCVHYFAIHHKLQKVHFASFRPECIKPLFVVNITRESEINVGTKARPVIKTVAEYAAEKIELSRALQERLTSEYETLTF